MRRLGALLVALVMVVVACGDDSAITIENEWARAGQRVVTNGAAYMHLTAAEDDALIGAAVDSSIADHAEVHEIVMDADGAMMMREMARLELPAGEMVELKPGSYHVMFIDVVETFEPGMKFDVTLQFENAGDITVEVEVFEEQP